MLELLFATEADTDRLVDLINTAFQVEKFFKIGERTHAAEVREHLQTGHFLMAQDEGGLAGAVYVEVRPGEPKRGYFGMLSVAPSRQKSGIGSRLIAAAEEFCREQGCRSMELSIVNLREELPGIYEKLGYKVSGTAPFPMDAMPVSQPCSFVLMEKELGTSA